MQIKNIEGYEVLDSRGYPTIEVSVRLEDGSVGRAIVPSGASTGMREAVELRDKDPQRYKGKGVTRAVHAVNGELRDALVGRDAFDQAGADATMIALDATPNKQRLGANALLGTSLAIAQAAAASQHVSLYRYVGGSQACVLPVPMINIINGGAHADNPIDFQEFMIVPVGAPSFTEAVRMGSEVFHTLRSDLIAAGFNTNVGDEGGFAPELRSATQALDLIMRAIDKAGLRAGEDVALAIDPAASEFHVDDAYHYAGEGMTRTRTQQVAYLTELARNYPLISIEDGMAENDIEGWQQLTEALGSRCQLVGDDVFCTNPTLLQGGIDAHFANAILVKPNQIGTLSETLQTVRVAHTAGYRVVMSHRSGETEDVSIADLAVATQCGQIKTGSISRADRTAKYNQLIRIERELGQGATYPGPRALSRAR